jgi:sodium/hydrogen antiporter
MPYSTLALVGLFIVLYAAISRRVDKNIVTGPMIFVAVGLVVGVLALVQQDVTTPFINVLAHVTLALVIFSDATRINVRNLRLDEDLPARLLLIGLPLTMMLGTGFALLIFTELSLWEAAVLAVILSPTDAALAQTVINSEKVPERVRQSINVESGLNDGLALPFLLLFISLAGTAGGEQTNWLAFFAGQLVLGPLTGVLVGYGTGKVLEWSVKTDSSDEDFRRVALLGVVGLAYGGAELVSGNGFVAVFVAGLILGATAPDISKPFGRFVEAEGAFLTLLTFLFFGAVILPDVIRDFDPRMLLYAGLSLTVVRLIPVGIALWRSGLLTPTIGYIGWFGPRGIASILYLLLLLEEGDLGLRTESILYNTAALTIGISVFIHGLSAEPLSTLYTSHLDNQAEEEKREEMRPVVD